MVISPQVRRSRQRGSRLRSSCNARGQIATAWLLNEILGEESIQVSPLSVGARIIADAKPMRNGGKSGRR
ncbi:MAG: hypothetical protein M3Y48_14275 [Actinomycetota bacterium]|nr:hypothetical protein [Actinomycetota bacterium]